MGVYNIKQVILVRKDLGMNKGKVAAQVAHASMGAFLKSFQRYGFEDGDNIQGIMVNYLDHPEVQEWLEGSFAKVVLAVNSEEELKAYHEIAAKAGLNCAYIEDNGTTVFNGVKTPTCLGVGPAKAEVLDVIFNQLKLF